MIKEVAERVCIIQPQHDKTKRTQSDTSLCPFLDLFSSPEPLTISPNGVNISFFLLLLHFPSGFVSVATSDSSLSHLLGSFFFFFLMETRHQPKTQVLETCFYPLNSLIKQISQKGQVPAEYRILVISSKKRKHFFTL